MTDAAVCAAAEATTWYDSDERSCAIANFAGAAPWNVRIARWRNGSRFANKTCRDKGESQRLIRIFFLIASTIDKKYHENTSRTVRTIREEISSGDSSSEDTRELFVRKNQSGGRKSRGLII